MRKIITDKNKETSRTEVGNESYLTDLLSCIPVDAIITARYFLFSASNKATHIWHGRDEQYRAPWEDSVACKLEKQLKELDAWLLNVSKNEARH